MKFVAVIPKLYPLSEEECLQYYGASLDKVKLRISRKDRYVFDKMVLSLPHQYIQILRE